MRRFVNVVCLPVLLFALIENPYAYTCTVLLVPQPSGPVLAANMDWPNPQGLILINKRDVQKTSAFIPAPQAPLSWTSKYMSLTFTQTGREFPWEGINEKGLAVTILQLAKTELPLPNSLPGVNGLQWVQYILDTSATVGDAITNAQSARVAGAFANTEHYFVCDASGNCATFECIFSNLVIHQGSSLPYPALANSGYQTSVTYLQNLLNSQSPSQILANPAVDSLTRFAKAALLSSQYTPAQDAVSYAFSALSSVRQNDTQWGLALGLAQQTVQYKTALSLSVKSISLSQFDPHCAVPVMLFHVNSGLSGDVTSSFSAYTPRENSTLVSLNGSWTTSLVAAVAAYPDTTQCTEPSTTVTSNANPSILGNELTVNATVVGNGTIPSGSVTFQNNGTVLGTARLDATGTAVLKTSSLALGTNLITASYSGNATNPASSSFPLSQIVAQPTQTMLTASANPSLVGQSVTFTAVINSPSGAIPKGVVTFSFGGKVTANAPLVNGQATYTRTLTISGTRLVTATYSGDGDNPPSISMTLNQIVN